MEGCFVGLEWSVGVLGLELGLELGMGIEMGRGEVKQDGRVVVCLTYHVWNLILTRLLAS